MSLLALSVVLVAVVGFVGVAYLRRWEWTGFVAQRPHEGGDSKPAGAAQKTLWDWLQILIVPVVLAAAAFALNDAQSRRQERQEHVRAARERAISADNRREEALRDYVQRMSGIVLSGARDGPASAARSVALTRTLTLTVLRRLDPMRKGIVVQFLVEADLIRSRRTGPISSMAPTSGEPSCSARPSPKRTSRGRTCAARTSMPRSLNGPSSTARISEVRRFARRSPTRRPSNPSICAAQISAGSAPPVRGGRHSPGHACRALGSAGRTLLGCGSPPVARTSTSRMRSSTERTSRQPDSLMSRSTGRRPSGRGSRRAGSRTAWR